MLKRSLLLVLVALLCIGIIGCQWGKKKEPAPAGDPINMGPEDEMSNTERSSTPWGHETMENIQRGATAE